MYSKDMLGLINNVIGQLNGIKKMIEEDRKCVDVIPQLKATKSAISSLLNKYVQQNAEICISDLDEKNKKELSNLIKELSKNDK